MSLLDTASLLLVISALFAYVNHRWIGLPTTIGIMVIALSLSVLVVVLDALGLHDTEAYAQRLLASVDFDETLMQGMLSFLLFAGALHVNLDMLLARRWVVGLLASVGVILTTLLIGGATWLVLGALGMDLPFIYCLLFGSLIAPTDPVAVLGMLKTAGVTESLETKIAGESLFNDGVAIVVFLVIGDLAASGHAPEVGHIAVLFLQEALGGALLGLVLGWLTYKLLNGVSSYQVEVLLTLALVTGGYALALHLHASGPIAVVVAGLLIGNHGRHLAMSETSREHLDTFWELVDEVLNAVLFLLIGLEMIVLSFTGASLLAALILALVVLGARFISVGIPVSLLKLRRDFHPHVIKIMTWGGLRGGISVALALSLPPSPERDVILPITYVIVVLSILVQGLTIQRLVRYAREEAET